MIHDIRHALRAFVRMPGFTATAIVTIALGIGANTAIFSVVYALLLKPLPFKEPDRLIYVHDTYPAVASASVSLAKFEALRDGNRTLESLTAMTPNTATLTGRGEPQQLTSLVVAGDFFAVLGVPPFAGRWITREDDTPAGSVVISYAAWQRVFGGAGDVVGQAVTLDGRRRLVAGIMPAGFTYPNRADVWVPLGGDASNNSNFLRLVGRMKPGVSIERATSDLKAVTAGFNAQSNSKRDVRVWPLHEYLTQNNRQMLLVLQGAVLLVLLVSCANVANMLLARSVARKRELAIRAAIGAGPGRLLRQLLTESVMLSTAGAAAGVLLASWLLRLFVSLAPANFAGVQTIAIDNRVLLFTLGVAMLTGLVFGVVPARRGFQLDAIDSLRDAGSRGVSGSGGGASRVLVVAEVSLAMVLVIGAALMVKSLLTLQRQDTGFRPDGLLTFQISLPQATYDDPKARRVVRQIVEDIRAVPSVKAAGASNYLPLINFGMNGPFSIQGRPPFPQDRAPVAENRMVTPGYFAAMNIPFRRGADFTDRDDEAGRPVVIINETMARQYWPNENPIGARLLLGMDGFVPREVVGVVGDVRSAGLSRAPVPETYVPHPQAAIFSMSIAVRTDVDAAAILPVVRQRMAAIDPALPIIKPQMMTAAVEASAGAMRLSSTLTVLFALLAALLATVGIYSLIAYSVAQRTREIGIRVALGANAASVLRLIVGEGLVLAIVGLVIGLAGTWALTSTVRTMLYEVSPLDPAVLAGACAGVLLVTMAACLVPATRVLRVDPTLALRAE